MFNLSSPQFGMGATPRPSVPKPNNGLMNQPGITKMPFNTNSGVGKKQVMPYKIGSSLGKVTQL